MDVIDDADDLPEIRLGFVTEIQALADGVGISPITVGQGRANDRYVWRARLVARGEVAAAKKRDAHGREIAWRGRAIVGGWLFARSGSWAAFNGKLAVIPKSGEREVVGGSDGLDAGDRTQVLQ